MDTTVQKKGMNAAGAFCLEVDICETIRELEQDPDHTPLATNASDMLPLHKIPTETSDPEATPTRQQKNIRIRRIIAKHKKPSATRDQRCREMALVTKARLVLADQKSLAATNEQLTVELKALTRQVQAVLAAQEQNRCRGEEAADRRRCRTLHYSSGCLSSSFSS